MRNISFAHTKTQIIVGSKSVTRRDGWWEAEPGDVLMGVEKGMGLKKGEKVKRLRQIRILSACAEPFDEITRYEDAKAELTREGFPTWTPIQFMALVGRPKHGFINRIEFEYVN